MEDASPISVDGKEGLAANISGKVTKTNLAGTLFLGQVVMIVLDNNRIFVSVALGLNTNGKDAWKTDGQTMFTALLQSAQFLEPPKGANLCKVSTDPTYGYNEKNPIRLGFLPRQENLERLSLMDQIGLAGLQGPRNEKAYLINLRGPAGQEVTYKRLGSFGGIADVILDGYQVQYAGQVSPVTLYLDRYTYQD